MHQPTIEGFRLSPQQAHIWSLQQGAQNTAYSAECTVAIEGPLNVDALNAALQEVVEQHEILRTTFHRLPSMDIPLQVIADEGAPVSIVTQQGADTLTIGDASTSSSKTRDAETRDAKTRDASINGSSTNSAAVTGHGQNGSRTSGHGQNGSHTNGHGQNGSINGLSTDRNSFLHNSGKSSHFNFEEGPLLHASLVAVGPAENLLTLKLPTLCADAAGLENLVAELSRAYTRMMGMDHSTQSAQDEEDEAMQYADLAEWQNELLEDEETEAGRAYWRRHPRLTDALSIKVPLERAKVDAQPPFSPQRHVINLDAHVAEQLDDLAQQYEVAPATIYLCGWQILLQRLSGQSDILVGTTYDGRKYEELQDALGLLARSLPVCTVVEDQKPLSQIISQTSAATDEIFKWQEYFTWEDLQDPTQPNATSQASWIPYAFEYAALTRQHQAGGLSFQITQRQATIDRFKLKLNCQPTADGMTLALTYDASFFAQSDIAQLGQQLTTLFGSIAKRASTSAEVPISQLSMTSAHERQRVLIDFNLAGINNSPVEHGSLQPLHQLFEAQVQHRPDAVAVISDGEKLTYSELNQRANQLAHCLRKLGVGPDVLVGICLERSVEMLIGFLGALKAGGAYVPLDVKLPPQRLGVILDDAQPAVIVSNAELTDRLAEASVVAIHKTIRLDSDAALLEQQPASAPAVELQPDNLVYVLFTSGSTGQPKGVGVTHGNLANYVRAATDRLDLPSDASYALVTTFAADLGNTSLFPSLCNGGTLHVIPWEQVADPLLLSDYCTRYQIDCLKIVPSHLAALLNSAHGAELLPKQRLIVGGESCSWELIEQVRRLNPDCLFFNHYGPTEGTVGVVTQRLDEGLPNSVNVPIGQPLANNSIYLLDDNMEPVPTWVAGTLYIGGAQVARGYLNRAGLTAERFVPDPYSQVPGARLYCTGDLARHVPTADGNLTIEFLGRADHQIKIRGFRVELGEIETTLRSLPKVGDGVVTVQDNGTDAPRLAAYFVGQPEAKITSEEIRQELLAQLPDYMVPADFVLLDALPLTPNGKIDRKALPAPEQVRTTEYVAPRTPTEQTVADIWSEVLNIEQVGVHDGFFALGGHSLMATQLISRIREACQVEIPLRQLFDSPTVAGITEYIENAGSSLMQSAPAIEPASRNAELPLSFAQQRMWFLNQLEPESAFYNLFFSVRLQGDLNLTVLEKTFTEIVRRHEILRTTFPTVDGRASQVIAPPYPVQLQVTELQQATGQTQDAQVKALIAAEAQKPFDLAHGPLFRIQLLKLAENDYVVQSTMHHIISDGWSSEVLVWEVATLYEAFVQGQPSPLPSLPIQYADFAHWQRNWLDDSQQEENALDSQLAYWRTQLGGELPVLQLPTDRQRPVEQNFHGARQELRLSPELSRAIKDLAQNEGATPFMFFLTAFNTLLHRYSGQDDILIGSPIANRNRGEIEGLIGCFVNTLVLRTDLSGNPSFRELLQRVRNVALDATANQDLPFEKLVDELQPERNLSHSPLFQVLFMMRNVPTKALELPGLTLSSIEREGDSAKFDLSLFVTEGLQDEAQEAGSNAKGNGGLEITLEYNTDLFDDSTIERMLTHFRRLLDGAVAAPDQDLMTLPLLTDSEQQTLLHEWNRAEIGFEPTELLHQRFERWAIQTPEAKALSFEKQSSSYKELNARANQLAHYLQKRGVGSGTLVAMYMERSVEMVVGILATLKAGGAYVPIDPIYPAERIAFMLEDTQAPVLLSQDGLLNRLPDCNACVISVDGDWSQIAQSSTENLSTPTNADATAYVIYTSGSTGKPKGVMVSHHNVMRLFQATDHWYNFAQDDVWTFFHSYAFDFSVWELWGALLYGARLVMVPYWVSREPEAFYQLLIDEQVTVLNQTPSAFKQLIAVERNKVANGQAYPERSRQDDKMDQIVQAPSQPPALSSLRYVIFGGEALELQSLRPWFDRHGDAQPQLVNMYGITETTVHVTYRPIKKADLDAGTGSVIGHAIPDLHLYVLDSKQQPVPIGVAGELYVGGAGVAKGYLNRPELTSERFIDGLQLTTDQLADGTDNRQPETDAERSPTIKDRPLYKTGDLVRYLANGDMEYLGRIDQQVKIRGFRIELGEIEAALAQHPDIQEVAVLARSEASTQPVDEQIAEKRLVAYLVANGDAEPTIAQLRTFLQTTLPDYMVPAAFVMLEALPLTANGKLDRKALPAPDLDRAALEQSFVPASNDVEETLSAIWAEVLGLDQVGVHDNFFSLGGDSILSIQIIARANAAGLYLTPKQMFQHQTIAELAAVAGTAKPIQAEQGMISGDLPLTPIQHWFFEQNLPQPNYWNQAVLLEVREQLAAEALEPAIRQLMEHHDVLRLRFRAEHTELGQTELGQTGSAWQQTIAEPNEQVPLTRFDLSNLEGGERAAVLEVEATKLQASLSLASGPLLQVAHFDFGHDEPDRLLVIIHHLAIDGVSWRILLEDLYVLWQQLSQASDAQASLPLKTTSFKFWAERLTEYATSHALQSESRYWLSSDRSRVVQLPIDMSTNRDQNTEASSTSLSVSLTVEETAALLHEVPEVYNTQIGDLLLAALTQTAAAWSGSESLLVDLEGHGREDLFDDVDLSRTVGWFTTIYPVLLTLPAVSKSNGVELGETLKSIKEQLRSIPNKGIGYGLLRYLSSDPAIQESLAALPQPEISFNYLGQLDQALPDSAPFALANEASGSVHSEAGMRTHLIDLRCHVSNGQLQVLFVYSNNLYNESTVSQLAKSYIGAVRDLISHCLSPDAGGFTPSDFPLADMAQDELDSAFDELEFA